MLPSLRLILVLLCTLVGPIVAVAATDEPLRDPSKLSTRKSSALRVSGVRVLVADYPLLARDFPALARKAQETENTWKARIDDWLVRETGFIAAEQAAQTTVNTPITTLPETKTSLRPARYNRAFVLPVEGGLVDAKGTGSLTPTQKHHANGLATLGEMLREYLYEKLVDRVLRHSGMNASTVGCYAVLDYGFNVIHEDGSQSRAGYVLRQAHKRAPGFNSSLDIRRSSVIEQTLRRYGLTSSGETMAGKTTWDYINIQGTDNPAKAEVLDFGAFMAVEGFSRRTVDPSTPFMFTLWKPDQPGFVQPDPMLRVPLEQWGDFGVHDPKADKPWKWSHELAESFADGRASRQDVEQHLRNLLGPVEARLPIEPGCGTWFSRL